jgi:hypothetical protein
MENDKLVTLIVATLSGKFEHEHNVRKTLQDVVNLTIEKLKLQAPPGEVWELRLGSTLLDLAKTIAEAHIPNHSVLKLAPRERGGGARS